MPPYTQRLPPEGDHPAQALRLWTVFTVVCTLPPPNPIPAAHSHSWGSGFEKYPRATVIFETVPPPSTKNDSRVFQSPPPISVCSERWRALPCRTHSPRAHALNSAVPSLATPKNSSIPNGGGGNAPSPKTRHNLFRSQTGRTMFGSPKLNVFAVICCILPNDPDPRSKNETSLVPA